MSDELSFEIGDDYPQFRRDVRALCETFPATYWRNLEAQPPSGSYPTDFVAALTGAGYLAALIPEEYGGWGLPVRAGARSFSSTCAKRATTAWRSSPLTR